jgi:hypothetical protein
MFESSADRVLGWSLIIYLLKCFVVPNSINVTKGPKEDRILTTGLHSVCDIYCLSCDDNIGWFYVRKARPIQYIYPPLACPSAISLM